MAGAREEADRVIGTAVESANALSAGIIEDAKAQAEQIRRRAQEDIDLERTKAFDELKGELSDIALDIASQVMEREIRQEDHEAFIDALISNVGDVS